MVRVIWSSRTSTRARSSPEGERNVPDTSASVAAAPRLVMTWVNRSACQSYSHTLLLRSAGNLLDLMSLPLLIGGVCIVTSIIGTYFVRLGAKQSIMGALYKGFLVTAILSVPALYGATYWVLKGDMNAVIGTVQTAAPGLVSADSFTGMDLFWCMLVGLGVTGLIVWITEYYTGTNYRPVQSIAKASITGHGTNVIQGLAISLESTALPAVCSGDM